MVILLCSFFELELDLFVDLFSVGSCANPSNPKLAKRLLLVPLLSGSTLSSCSTLNPPVMVRMISFEF